MAQAMGEAGGGYRGTRHVLPSWQVPVTPRRPPSLPLICRVFPALSSFSGFIGTPMAFYCVYFKELNCYETKKGTLQKVPFYYLKPVTQALFQHQ
jgi:hypothetical protein